MTAGHIIIRQRGKTYHPGDNCGIGRDYTLYALTDGWVKFVYNADRKRQFVTISDIDPHAAQKKRNELIEESAASLKNLEI